MGKTFREMGLKENSQQTKKEPLGSVSRKNIPGEGQLKWEVRTEGRSVGWNAMGEECA